KGIDDDEIGVMQFLGDIFVDTYGDENGETSHNTISDFLTTKAFVIKIMIHKYFNKEMPLDIIKNLYVSFGIPFDPKMFYKDGAYASVAEANVHRVHVLDFDVLMKDMDQDLTNKLRMEHTYVEEKVLFTSYAWRALLGIRGPLVRETRISSSGDFLSRVPSYTVIREPLGRLCHRVIAFTIAGRGQAPEKVTSTDLFYLRSMDEGRMVNVPYLLVHYLFTHASGRKQGARMSGGHFISRLGVHFGVITEQRLQTLRVEDRGLTTIDVEELKVRAEGGAAQVDLEAPREDMLASKEGIQVDPTPQQAPQIPQAAAPIPRTIPQRINGVMLAMRRRLNGSHVDT
ncbi:hypothetical protein Tco_0115398, partial [Tanacetum coccineum]